MKTVQFIGIILTALALVPGGAHILALPNKISLDEQRYMTIQQIYRGWALLGIVVGLAFVANAVLAFLSRSQQAPFMWSAAAAALVALSLVIFFVWTFPANQATSNWTETPSNLQELRTQWEYSHAVNAIVTLTALCCVTISSLSWSD